MKPYNIKGCGINKCVDLDSVLEIESPDVYELQYRLAFTDNPVRIKYNYDFHYKFERECYLPFLEAWKNKDVINSTCESGTIKEIVVKIKYDERRCCVDSSFVDDALQEYTKGDGIVSVEVV